MKKILFLGLLVIGLLIVYGCVPPAGEEGVADDAALAGQAIALGCQTTKVASCTESGNTVTGTQRGASRTSTFRLTDGCTGRNANVAQNYSCISSTERRVCRTQCTAGEVCTSGVCIVCTPNAEICDSTDNNCNAVVDESGVCNTTANCGTFGNACASGQVCTNGACVTPPVNSTTNVTNCTDSDGNIVGGAIISTQLGDSIYREGQVTYNGRTYYDQCTSLSPDINDPEEGNFVFITENACQRWNGTIRGMTLNTRCPQGYICPPGGRQCVTFQINSTTNVTNQTGVGNFTNQTLINQTAGNSTNRTNSTG